MVSRSREGEEGPWPGVSEPELQISRAAQSARPGNQDPSVKGRDPDADIEGDMWSKCIQASLPADWAYNICLSCLYQHSKVWSAEIQ